MPTTWRNPELLPEWGESMGDAPYVFKDKPLGHRCLWTCRYVQFDRDGRQVSKSYNPNISQMSDEEKCAELLDVVFLDLPQSAQAARALLAYHEGPEFWSHYKQALGFLAQARLMYPEYLPNWNEDFDFSRIVEISERPGWELSDDLKERIKLERANRARDEQTAREQANVFWPVGK